MGPQKNNSLLFSAYLGAYRNNHPNCAVSDTIFFSLSVAQVHAGTLWQFCKYLDFATWADAHYFENNRNKNYNYNNNKIQHYKMIYLSWGYGIIVANFQNIESENTFPNIESETRSPILKVRPVPQY